ncbi:MAG: hypothetical protein KC731_12055 [Myxococcales bacterium]|nr:hypothetical protein [Myxococcales bacterium]
MRAAYLAAYGAHDQATQVLSAISNDTKRFGRISGQVSLVFPGLAEPLWFGSGAHVQPNLALVRAYERGLLGDYRAAEELARPQAGRQPIATASALGRVYAAQGRHDLAANAVGSVASMAPGAAASLLYYQWATHLADSGALAQARDVFGRLGEFGDSRARATVLEGQLDEARERQAVERQNAAERAREAKRRRVDQEDQLVLAEALDRVELASGPRSRDQALDWGLERIRQEHVRHQLRLEASRLEVRAVLDKVEGLKTPAAKRRNIEEALDRLRADRVRDELQATEIALLEAALRDLEGGR